LIGWSLWKRRSSWVSVSTKSLAFYGWKMALWAPLRMFALRPKRPIYGASIRPLYWHR